ncbi:MAG: GtrA family protein [Agathobacter sp.]|nr:GtrA family protein [Agathobacter sp.]
MKKVINQFLKFSIVGGISFLVDFTVFTIMCNVFRIHYMIAGVLGFLISVIINYILSMRFVFVPKEDIRKDKSFVVFVILSLIGMLINSILLFIFIDILYGNIVCLRQVLSEESMNIFAKIFATVIVMLYNFITRKIFLEKKENI